MADHVLEFKTCNLIFYLSLNSNLNLNLNFNLNSKCNHATTIYELMLKIKAILLTETLERAFLIF